MPQQPAHHHAVLDGFICPCCHRGIVTTHDRLPLPKDAIGRYNEVYQCPSCHRHVGGPVNVTIVRRLRRVTEEAMV